MTRLPIRLRVTLAFAGVMALLLAALSGFLVLRLQEQLDQATRQALRTRATDLATLAGQGRPLSEEDASIAQLLAADGRVSGATASAPRTSLLSAAQQRAAARRPLFLRTGGVELLAMPRDPEQRDGCVVVVGESLRTRDQAVARLESELLIAMPIALLLAGLAGWAATSSALRPVRSMTRRARAIDAATPGQRLPVPRARDEVSELGDTLNAMLARLEEGLEHERRFVADASHELRTPLAIVSAEIHVALETAQSVEEHRAALGSLAVQNARVVRLAENLLVLARADQQALSIAPEPLDLATSVRDCAARFARRAGAVRIDVDAEDDLFASADEVRLDQLLDNLVDNALRFAHAQIRLCAAREGTLIVLAVEDDGPGFDPGFAARAFDRFAVADDARGDGHAGLGLAIVDAIARAHGGHARLAGGARVEVRLPALAFAHPR